MNNGVKDVPALIKRGSSEELRQALAEVRTSYGETFKSGGFNPRPQKDSNYRYLLGTISEHGMGDAVDIEDTNNPILSFKDWKFIEQLAGKPVDRSLSRWKKNPKELWQDVKDVNDLFVKNLGSEIVKEEEKQKADSSVSAKKNMPKPIDKVLSKHRNLKKWANGFFTLEWKLVEQLHAHDFRWGVTFSNADLHHVQIMK